MQPWELGEDCFEHEVLRNSKCLNIADGHVLILRALGSKNIIVTDVAKALVVLSNRDLLLADVFLAGI